MLLAAWRIARHVPGAAALVLAGDGERTGPLERSAQAGGVRSWSLGRRSHPRQPARRVCGVDVLVVPSIATRTFREPWGLAVNEAMNQGLAVIATDAVGAAAGGLVRDGENGLIVPAERRGRAGACDRRLGRDERLRGALGAAGARDVAAYSHDAWARGFSRALASSDSPGDVASVAQPIHADSPAVARADLRSWPPLVQRDRARARRPSAGADVGAQIIERCTHGESLSGFSQHDYSQALSELQRRRRRVLRLRHPDPPSGAGGRRRRQAAARPERRGGAAPIPLTPAEQPALSHAATAGSEPLQVGNQIVRPGVVPVDIASALNSLPTPLLATLAFLLACLALVDRAAPSETVSVAAAAPLSRSAAAGAVPPPARAAPRPRTRPGRGRWRARRAAHVVGDAARGAGRSASSPSTPKAA